MAIYGNAIMTGAGQSGGDEILPTDAILRVQAPAGSTVTITKGSITKSDMGHENADDNTVYDYYFIIHQSQLDSVNPWTVTATDGVDTATDTVIIDAADEYNIELGYKIYLLKDGVIPSNPWGTYENTRNTSFTSGEIVMSLNSSQGAFFGFSAASSTNYRTLHFNLSATQSASEPAYQLHVGVTSAKVPSNANMTQALSYYLSYTISGNTNGYVTIDVDISSVNSQAFYVSAMCVASVSIKEIWMD